MAYENFDQFGNYLGGYGLVEETEEERRKRLANQMVGKTEVQTYADGSVTRKTTEEIPAPGPVSPDEIYKRLVQTESGGRDFTANGQPVTSPAGAMFAGQVMPSTAAQPGFGIRPAQSQTPDEYNRVSKEYFNAMLQRYGGDYQKALAAYNAGPGRIDQNIAANQGQLNVSALPGETQGYLNKILGGVKTGAQAVMNTLVPPAQAATVDPGEERRRRALEQRPPLPAAAPPATAPAVPAAAPPAAMTPTPDAQYQAQDIQEGPVARAQTMDLIGFYQQNQNDPEALMRIRKDQSQPEWIRERAAVRTYELLYNQIEEKKAQLQARQLAEAAANGDPKASRTIAKELQNTDGSWLKMILLGFISPDLAGREAIKLGLANTFERVTDDQGRSGLIEIRGDGKPVSGTWSDGTTMTSGDLISQAGAAKKAYMMPSVHGSPVVKEVQVGTDAEGKPITQQIGGMRMYDPRTRQTYVQVGNKRMPDVDWVTTGQAPGAVYAAAGAKAQGTAAGEGYTPSPLPQRPGQPGVPAAAPAAEAPAVPAAAGAPVPAAGPIAPGAAPGAAPGPAPAAAPAPAPAAPAPATGVIPPLTGPAAQKSQAERQGKEREAVIKSNQEFGTELNKARQTGVAQKATIERLQAAIDRNPEFWGIDTNSTIWRAYVDINSTNEKRAEALNTLARNLNIPREKRAEFDQTMNDYRNLQVNAITSSGLSASQTNSEKESQRVVNVVGSISDKPAAAKATLEYAKAKIAYTEAKARAWNEARKRPGADYVDFEIEFDRTQGEKIFADANERMAKIIGSQPGTGSGTTSSGNRFRRIQ